MKTLSTFLKIARWAVLGLAVAIGLSACGGGSGDGAQLPSALTPIVQNAKVYAADQLLRPTALLRDRPNAAATSFTGHGWYWDAAAGGTGMMFEAQGDTGFAGLFMYEADGRPVWYVASGPFTIEGAGYRFTGQLRRYQDGQTLGGAWREPTSTLVGDVSMVFSGAGTTTRAAVALPGGRTWNVERFNFGALGWGPAPTQTETGWFWNKAESGRGYAMEIQGTQVFMAMFHYTAAGAPTWQIVTGDFSSGVMADTAFNAYSGGQTLTGTPKTPTAAQEGTMHVSFSRACDGNIMLPGTGQWLGIERFTFGTSQPCRVTAAGNPFGGNLVTSVPEASYFFLSEERKAWNVLNAERSRCGFGLMSQNPLLDQAARNHRDYLIANPGIENFSHTEVVGRPGFTGINPQDRTDAVGYNGISTEGINGLAGGANLQGSSRLRVLLSGVYHALNLLRGDKENGIGYGNGIFQLTHATRTGVALQTASGVRTWPCRGSVEAPFGGSAEVPSPFPNEQNPVWGTPILVKGDGVVRIDTATITGPDGVAVPIKAIYGDGQTIDPQDRCKGDVTCILPVLLSKKTVYQVRLTGTNGGQPLHPSGALSFSFTTSGVVN